MDVEKRNILLCPAQRRVDKSTGPLLAWVQGTDIELTLADIAQERTAPVTSVCTEPQERPQISLGWNVFFHYLQRNQNSFSSSKINNKNQNKHSTSLPCTYLYTAIMVKNCSNTFMITIEVSWQTSHVIFMRQLGKSPLFVLNNGAWAYLHGCLPSVVSSWSQDVM